MLKFNCKQEQINASDTKDWSNGAQISDMIDYTHRGGYPGCKGQAPSVMWPQDQRRPPDSGHCPESLCICSGSEHLSCFHTCWQERLECCRGETGGGGVEWKPNYGNKKTKQKNLNLLCNKNMTPKKMFSVFVMVVVVEEDPSDRFKRQNVKSVSGKG